MYVITAAVRDLKVPKLIVCGASTVSIVVPDLSPALCIEGVDEVRLLPPRTFVPDAVVVPAVQPADAHDADVPRVRWFSSPPPPLFAALTVYSLASVVTAALSSPAAAVVAVVAGAAVTA
jgi:hypothetical protein